jgi:Flp pilus assembly protein TadG
MIVIRHQPSRSDSGEHCRGSVLVFVVFGVVLLLAMTMISVDVASMQLVRTELRATSDAAAKAGVESLLRTQSKPLAIQAALTMAQLNTVAGKPFKIAPQDVVIGTSTRQSNGSWAFTAGGTRPNSVRVNSRMTADSASGPVTLAFAKVFGSEQFTPTKTSTASALQQEICLAIDRSASMSFDLSGEDWVYPPGGEYNVRPRNGSRWDALKNALNHYSDAMKNTAVPSRVALVTWASDMTSALLPETEDLGLPLPTTPVPSYVTSILESGLSYTFGGIDSAIKRRSEHPLHGSTNMSAGIDKAVETLTASDVLPYAQRSIILMTDGLWNQGRNPREAAEDARDQGIVIHVVTFLPGAESVDAQAVASITGGVYIHTESESELIAAFEKLAATLPVVLTD